MMILTSIEVSGTSERGRFVGRIDLGSGLQVITAENRYGKSTAFAAAVWCLGVEQIYGASAGDPNIFPDAARGQLEIDGERDVQITSSKAKIEIERSDGAQLCLTRAIQGGDTMQIGFDDGEVSGNLKVGYGSSTSGVAGFQAGFRAWAGLPEFRLMSSRGGPYPIYLENLAALFLIEQIRGWTDIQAEQVYRYGLHEVADGCIEYILGLDDWLEERLDRQRATSSAAALKAEASVVANEFSELIEMEGWSGEIPTRGSVPTLVKKWAEANLLEMTKERFGFDYSSEQVRLNERLSNLKERLSAPTDLAPGSAPTSSSQEVLALKQKRHEIQGELARLRSQLSEQEALLNSTTERRASAEDLLRLKRDGIGILPAAECPTCHRSVSPADLELKEQTTEAIELHVSSVGRQRDLLLRNVALLKTEVIGATAQAQRADEAFDQAQRTLGLVNAAFGSSREETLKLATDILKIERELDRNRRLYRRLIDLQARVDSWVSRANDLVLVESEEPGRPAQLKAFEAALRKNVVALGVGGVGQREAASLHLGEHYDLRLGKRALPAYGSASDRARLVLSHSLALLECGARHPGFVLLDEPVQQNPDPLHRKRLIDFLCDFGTDLERQAIVFTSLEKNEIEKIREAGVSVQELKGRFLEPAG